MKVRFLVPALAAAAMIAAPAMAATGTHHAKTAKVHKAKAPKPAKASKTEKKTD